MRRGSVCTHLYRPGLALTPRRLHSAVEPGPSSGAPCVAAAQPVHYLHWQHARAAAIAAGAAAGGRLVQRTLRFWRASRAEKALRAWHARPASQRKRLVTCEAPARRDRGRAYGIRAGVCRARAGRVAAAAERLCVAQCADARARRLAGVPRDALAARGHSQGQRRNQPGPDGARRNPPVPAHAICGALEAVAPCRILHEPAAAHAGRLRCGALLRGSFCIRKRAGLPREVARAVKAQLALPAFRCLLRAIKPSRAPALDRPRSGDLTRAHGARCRRRLLGQRARATVVCWAFDAGSPVPVLSARTRVACAPPASARVSRGRGA